MPASKDPGWKRKSPVAQAMRPDLSREAGDWFVHICLPVSWKPRLLSFDPYIDKGGYGEVTGVALLSNFPGLTHDPDRTMAVEVTKGIGTDLSRWIEAVPGASVSLVGWEGGGLPYHFRHYRFAYSTQGCSGDYVVWIVNLDSRKALLIARLTDVQRRSSHEK